MFSAEGPKAQHKCTTDETQYQPCSDAGYLSLGDLAAGPRFERMVERVHNLGPRPLAELLAEIATATGEHALIADRVEAYARVDPAIVRAFGADSFPPMPLEVVP